MEAGISGNARKLACEASGADAWLRVARRSQKNGEQELKGLEQLFAICGCRPKEMPPDFDVRIVKENRAEIEQQWD